MCGGFAAIAGHSKFPVKNQWAYHTGRLITYTVFGGVAGMLGHSLDSVAGIAGIQQGAALLTGIVLLLSGTTLLLGRPLHVVSRLPFSSFISRLHRVVLEKVRDGKSLWALFLGLLSTLLPCGWLYTYLAVAAGTGWWIDGVVVMFIFWLGTLPMLITVGALSYGIASPLQRYIPRVISLLMILAGIFALCGHLGIGFMHHEPGSAMHCH